MRAMRVTCTARLVLHLLSTLSHPLVVTVAALLPGWSVSSQDFNDFTITADFRGERIGGTGSPVPPPRSKAWHSRVGRGDGRR